MQKHENSIPNNLYGFLDIPLAMATELLTRGELSIQENFQPMGLLSPYYFSLGYKKYNAVPPLQTKKEYIEEKHTHDIRPKS